MKNFKDIDRVGHFRDMRSYFDEVKNYPLASIQEEIDLTSRAQAGDIEARDKMIKMNLKLVINISKKFVGRGSSVQDLISSGNIALFKAIDKYKGSFGFKFSTYASGWIKQAMYRVIEDEAPRIKIPNYMQGLKRKIRKARESLQCEGVFNISVGEMMMKMGKTMPSETISGIALAEAVSNVASSQQLSYKHHPKYHDYSEIETLEEISIMKEKIKELSEREREIISLRYGLDGNEPMTLEDVAKTISPRITRERVRQLICESLTVLREKMRDRSEKEE